MKFQAIVSYRLSGPSGDSRDPRGRTPRQTLCWRGAGQGRDFPSITTDLIKRVRRTKRRPLVIVGVNIFSRETK